LPPRSPDITSQTSFLWGYVKDKVYATKGTGVEDLKTRIRMSSQQSTEACWLTHGKNWNFDWMYSVRHRVLILKCAECIKKALFMYPSNKISFTFFLAIYNF
jgi:hypothetical protein